MVARARGGSECPQGGKEEGREDGYGGRLCGSDADEEKRRFNDLARFSFASNLRRIGTMLCTIGTE